MPRDNESAFLKRFAQLKKLSYIIYDISSIICINLSFSQIRKVKEDCSS